MPLVTTKGIKSAPNIGTETNKNLRHGQLIQAVFSLKLATFTTPAHCSGSATRVHRRNFITQLLLTVYRETLISYVN